MLSAKLYFLQICWFDEGHNLHWFDSPVTPEWGAVWMLGRPAGPRAASSCESTGAAFAPDVTWPARALLMDVYHLQTICWQVGIMSSYHLHGIYNTVVLVLDVL